MKMTDKNKTGTKRRLRGITLLEITVAMIIGVIVVFSTGITLLDGHKGWQKIYRRINGPVANDSYVTETMFRSIIRKSSRNRYRVGTYGQSLEVYYYSDGALTKPDRYARFYTTDRNMFVDQGQINADTYTALNVDTTLKLASTIDSATFSVCGTTASAFLRMQHNEESANVVISAIRQNY